MGDDETSKISGMQTKLGAFPLSNNKRIRKHYLLLKDGIKTDSVC